MGGKPREGPLDCPTFGLDPEASLAGFLSDDLELSPQGLSGPVHDAAGEALARPDLTDSGVVEPGPQQRTPGAVAVLDIRCDDVNGQERAEGVGDDEPLAALDLLPASKHLVVAGAVSAVRTDCESISPALGSALPPSASRNWLRSASWMRSAVPSSCHHVKYQYTVGHGAKSFGICRQAQPVRTT